MDFPKHLGVHDISRCQKLLKAATDPTNKQTLIYSLSLRCPDWEMLPAELICVCQQSVINVPVRNRLTQTHKHTRIHPPTTFLYSNILKALVKFLGEKQSCFLQCNTNTMICKSQYKRFPPKPFLVHIFCFFVDTSSRCRTRVSLCGSCNAGQLHSRPSWICSNGYYCLHNWKTH